MNKQIYRLTESDLHNIIRESVENVLRENMENEGFGSYLRSLGRQGKQKGMEAGERLGKSAGNAFNSVTNWVGDKYNSAKQGLKTMHQNAMQDSSMSNMNSSLDAFQKDLQVYLKNGGKVDRQFMSRLSGIMNTLNNYQQH